MWGCGHVDGDAYKIVAKPNIKQLHVLIHLGMDVQQLLLVVHQSHMDGPTKHMINPSLLSASGITNSIRVFSKVGVESQAFAQGWT